MTLSWLVRGEEVRESLLQGQVPRPGSPRSKPDALPTQHTLPTSFSRLKQTDPKTHAGPRRVRLWEEGVRFRAAQQPSLGGSRRLARLPAHRSPAGSQLLSGE